MKNFENTDYQKALKQVREIKSFYYNLTCYCVVIPVLISINLTYVPDFHWFWFSMLGWGTGLTIHAMSAFGYVPFLGRNWEDRKIKELINKYDK